MLLEIINKINEAAKVVATGHQLSSNYGGEIMKSNRFVDNLPIYDLCLRSVTYKSRGGKGGVHHGILKYDQLCKIHFRGIKY